MEWHGVDDEAGDNDDSHAMFVDQEISKKDQKRR